MTSACEEPLRFVELESLHKTADGYYEWQEISRYSPNFVARCVACRDD